MTRPPFDIRADGQVVVAGSLAFDHIMVYPGNFKDEINTDKLHVISVSFLIEDLKKRRGGCAGNIAYTLALLDRPVRIVATAGSDFGDYRAFLERHRVDLGGLVVHDDVTTASGFATTDQADNQIWGFHPGAMARAGELSMSSLAGDRPALVIVAPDDPEAMRRHCQEARNRDIPLLYDPSFQVTNMPGEHLVEAARGAQVLMLNDYEHGTFEKKTGKEGKAIFELVDMVVVTLGAEGSKILLADGNEIHVPAAQVEKVVDPTGAGDAYRGGFAAGLVSGYDLEVCGRMGSVAAAYAVEHQGTQEHAYTGTEFGERYRRAYGELPG